MAGNFNIDVSKTGDCVRLKLNGEFDGSSACQLLNLLNNGALSGHSRILVDTDSLKHIHPFGLEVLHSRLHKKKGKKFHWFSPVNCRPVLHGDEY
jgi:anti-anti-sigma factor